MHRAICVLVAAAAMVVVGQAGAANYPMFLGEQQPCGFIHCAGAPAGIPKGATLEPVPAPGGHDQRRGHDHVLERELPHGQLRPKPPALILPDPSKGKLRRRSTTPPGTRSASSGCASSSTTRSPSARSARRRSRARRRPRAARSHPPARRRSRRPSPTRFPKAGTYNLICTIHPGMKATVVVKPAGTPVPKTPAQVQAQALDRPDGGVGGGERRGQGGEAAREHGLHGRRRRRRRSSATSRRRLKVKAGTTVTFVNRSPSEVHNVVFGPKKYIEQLAKTDRPAADRPDGAEPGHADPDLRLRAEGEVRLRRQRTTATASSAPR